MKSKRSLVYVTAACVSAGALTLIPASAEAQSCRTGSCGSVDYVKQVTDQAKRAQPVVESGSLADAHRSILAVAALAEKNNIARNRDVQTAIGTLASTLRERSERALREAIASYFEGQHSEALAKFEEIAALEGLPAARDARSELDKEGDRAAWRTARDLAVQQIDQRAYIALRASLEEVDRLSRRTGYSDQTDTLFAGFNEKLTGEVEATAGLIEAEQFDRAYATLVEVSRLSELRQAAAQARRTLGETRSIDGMRVAGAEYEAKAELEKIRTAISELGSATARDMAPHLRALSKLTTQYPGTAAAAEAEQLYNTLSEQYAAR